MKILLIKTSSLGDLIHTLPALTDLQYSSVWSKELALTWLVEENFREIPNWHPAVTTTLPIAWRRWRKNLWQAYVGNELSQFWQQLRAQNYDLIIDAQGLIKSALLASCARGVRCGYDITTVREKLATLCYQQRHQVLQKQHAVTRIRKLFAQIVQYPCPTTTANFQLVSYFQQLPPFNLLAHYPANQVKPQNISAAVRKLEGGYLVFCHATQRAEKTWGVEKWRALAAIAIAAGFTVYLPWGNTAELTTAQLIAEQQCGIFVLPALNLTAIGQLLFAAAGVVAVDTGFSHLAAALGRPTVTLYGPTDPQLIGTLGVCQQRLLNFNQLTAVDVWQAFQELIA